MNFEIHKNVKQCIVKPDQVVSQWQSWMLYQRGLSPITIRNRVFTLYELVVFIRTLHGQMLSPKMLESIPLKDFRSWVVYLKQNCLTENAIRSKIITLRQFFKFLAVQYGIYNKEFHLLKMPKEKRIIPETLSSDSVKRILKTLKTVQMYDLWEQRRDYTIIMLLYGAGLRISEVLGITQNDILGEWLRVTGKGTKQRQVPLLTPVMQAINLYKAFLPYRPESYETLFKGLQGKPLQTSRFNRNLKIIAHHAGINHKLSSHMFRHCYATHLLENGGDIMTIKELLGHERISTTQIYTKISGHSLMEIYSQCHPRA